MVELVHHLNILWNNLSIKFPDNVSLLFAHIITIERATGEKGKLQIKVATIEGPACRNLFCRDKMQFIIVLFLIKLAYNEFKGDIGQNILSS